MSASRLELNLSDIPRERLERLTLLYQRKLAAVAKLVGERCQPGSRLKREVDDELSSLNMQLRPYREIAWEETRPQREAPRNDARWAKFAPCDDGRRRVV